MDWVPWSRVDDRGLARYVTDKAARWFDLEASRFDLRGQPGERRRVVEAVYNALVRLNIHYDIERYHPSDSQQIIRSPDEVLQAPRAGTCLDLAATFCGLCLSNDLLPMLVVIQNHALALVSLTHGLNEWNGYRPERSWFDNGPQTDSEPVRELVQKGEYLAIECTGFARSDQLAAVARNMPEGIGRTPEGILPFERAIAAGGEQLVNPERPFTFALDIAVAQYQWKIEPLAVQQVVESWDEARRLVREQTGRFLREAQGTQSQRGPFIPEVYVQRPSVERELQAFLASQEPGLVVVGPAGVGKTSLSCHWAQGLLDAGHAVLAYECAGLASPDIETQIARDLAVGPRELRAAFDRIRDLAGVQERQFLILFDAVNEFRDANQADPVALLKQIDGLVRRLPADHVRIVVTCSLSLWEHMDRLTATLLSRAAYFTPADGRPYVLLERYTPEECEAAYQLYRRFFSLQTPPEQLSNALRERLRDPLIMRMLAELYRDRAVLVTQSTAVLGILQEYYNRQVKPIEDELFATGLAAEMLRRQRLALPVLELARHPELGAAIKSGNANSSYNRLLDRGIVTEITSGPLHDTLVKFSHLDIGAYALARHLLRQDPPPDLKRVTDLASGAGHFPLAWSTARTLVLLSFQDNRAWLQELAQSADTELRELGVEALLELYAERPQDALDYVERLLDLDSKEARRTALKASYLIGPGARNVFFKAARRGSEPVREATKDTLYLQWRSNPQFVYNFQTELGAGLGLTTWRPLTFLLDLSVTIYINHCENLDVGAHTADLWFDVLVHRLHLPKSVGPLNNVLEKLIALLARAFSQPILDSMLFGTAASSFTLSDDERACFRRVIPFVDPQADLQAAAPDLATLLRSKAAIVNMLAGLVLAIHSYRGFEKTEPLARHLFEGLDPHGRLWEILGYAVLLPDTPPAWTPMLEQFTTELIETSPATVFGAELYDGADGPFDISLLPLGLAYGKSSDSMPYLESLIGRELKQGDSPWRARCVAALGPLGFYYPKHVLRTLNAAIPNFADQWTNDGLVDCLSLIRTLHLDAVDTFLHQIGAEPAFQRRVAARSDVQRLQRYIRSVGLYNNAVHQAINYPRMRRRLLMGGLNALADAKRPADFFNRYMPAVIGMAREAGYQLREWTRPE